MRVGVALILILLAVGVLSACGTVPAATVEPLPTAMTDLDAAATAAVLTQNAPPAPFRGAIDLSSIERGLAELTAWRYTVTAEFSGAFAGTSRPAEGITTAEVSYNQLNSARRAVLRAEGTLFGEGDPVRTEAVRLGTDTFLISEGGCSIVTNTDAASVVDAGASLLIGGIAEASGQGMLGTINGEPVYRFGFAETALRLASVSPGESGEVRLLSQELWFSAERGTVVRLYLTLSVDNGFVFGSQTPVTGQVILRYDLVEIGIDPNISVPFGC